LARQSAATPKNLSAEALNDLVIDAIQDIKGNNIVKLDLRELDDAPTDYFIICEGESSTQIKAIADNIEKRLKIEMNVKPAHSEGRQSATWVLVDYFYTVVHIFYGETRTFYDLDDLWSDGQLTEYQNL
jgi:ribosome-associated protein